MTATTPATALPAPQERPPARRRSRAARLVLARLAGWEARQARRAQARRRTNEERREMYKLLRCYGLLGYRKRWERVRCHWAVSPDGVPELWFDVRPR